MRRNRQQLGPLDALAVDRQTEHVDPRGSDLDPTPVDAAAADVTHQAVRQLEGEGGRDPGFERASGMSRISPAACGCHGSCSCNQPRTTLVSRTTPFMVPGLSRAEVRNLLQVVQDGEPIRVGPGLVCRTCDLDEHRLTLPAEPRAMPFMRVRVVRPRPQHLGDRSRLEAT